MLEHLLTWWKGKLFVLTLLGFAVTDFMITITLSAADASAHLIQNPFTPHFFHGQSVPITLFLVALLGAVFLKGFKDAIGIAVTLVGVYLALNLIVAIIGLEHIVAQPQAFVDWTTLVNVIERPDGLKIGAFFIAAIVLSSLVSRLWRTTELRVEKITLDNEAQHFINEIDAQGELRIIANKPRRCDETEYTHREQEQREDNNIPSDESVVFLEIYVRDASEFSADLNVHGVSVGRHRVLRGESAAVANAIAAFLLYLRDDKGKVPHAYFNWTEGNPLLYLLHYVLSGEGDVAPVTREVLRKAEPNAQRRPAIHGGNLTFGRRSAQVC
jgi:hypothetical protein